jgi:hypothetical protein
MLHSGMRPARGQSYQDLSGSLHDLMKPGKFSLQEPGRVVELAAKLLKKIKNCGILRRYAVAT